LIRFIRDEDGYKRPTNFIKEKYTSPLINKSQNKVGTNENASSELVDIMGMNVFDNPKPTTLIEYLTNFIVEQDDIVLDFFSGSATTAHAIMKLNQSDAGNRKYILVQLAEDLDENLTKLTGPAKTTTENAISFLDSINKPHLLTEVSKERIRRAGKKIKEENAGKEGIENLDIGFRVLKIDSSNMKDIYFSPDALDKESLFDTVDHIKEDRTAEDLLFGVLVDWGVDLTLPIRREEILGKTVFFVGEDALTACFDEELDEAFFKELATRDALRVVFKESGFKDDETKINAEQIFKQLAPGSDLRVI
jgi:adenine-specific DNA-methyltransferase